MAETLRPGEVILLYGDIGAGKSVLARGIVHGLPGGEGLAVRSPTFVYVRHYPTRPPVHHVDLYRLPMDTPPEEIGLEEWTNAGSVTIIEWAQRLAERNFSQRTEVRIESLGGDRRRVEILRK
jgi:tRNA threonylcarbamoyladenosine biosynthesis protein TsaE